MKSAKKSASSTPRWVKVLAIAAALFLLAVAVLHLTGNALGGHAMHGHHP
jgi:hypothetical protein